jgi:hypothetical protein
VKLMASCCFLPRSLWYSLGPTLSLPLASCVALEESQATSVHLSLNKMDIMRGWVLGAAMGAK